MSKPSLVSPALAVFGQSFVANIVTDAVVIDIRHDFDRELSEV
jgi:hypothetical protein